ncbi:MAG: cyclophilin-like fold protein [Candidatus Helarchaeota archaeon]
MVKKIKIIIKSVNIELEAELFDTPTAQAIWNALPFKSNINTWGNEIYFDIPVTLDLEKDARANVDIGEIGYWDVGKSMCIFWGRTPASKDDKPVAASPVNVFGKVIGDPTVLNAVNDGDEIIVEKI